MKYSDSFNYFNFSTNLIITKIIKSNYEHKKIFKRIKSSGFLFLLFFIIILVPLKSKENINETEGNYWIGASLLPFTNSEMSYCYFLTYNFEKILLSINYYDKTQDNSNKSLNFSYDNLYTSEYSALLGLILGEEKLKFSLEAGIGYFSRKRVSYINNNSHKYISKTTVINDFSVPFSIKLLYCPTNWIGFGFSGFFSLNNIDSNTGFGITVIFGKTGKF
ncbi:MAG: hypothetical protein V1779_07810 [bacterium]